LQKNDFLELLKGAKTELDSLALYPCSFVFQEGMLQDSTECKVLLHYSLFSLILN